MRLASSCHVTKLLTLRSYKRANIQAGENVLITGASGAAGMAAVELAKILSARVIVTGRSDQKLSQVLGHGADEAIKLASSDSIATGEKLRVKVKELTGGDGVDVVYDTVGGDMGYEALRSLKFGGRYVVVGWASNVSESGGRNTFVPDRLPTNILQMKCLQVMGSPMVIYSMRNPDWRKKQISQISKWADEKKIHPFVSHQFPLDSFKEAARAKINGEVTGSCVLSL